MLSTMRKMRRIEHCRCCHLMSRLAHRAFFLDDEEVPFEEQTHFFELLKTHYELRSTEPNFGQNATTLLVLTRRDAQKGTKE